MFCKSRIPLIILVFCLGTPSLYGQGLGLASFRGSVMDPSGAGIPNATVQAVNKATGYTRTAITDAMGLYSLPSLGVGVYTVTAEAASFKSASSDEPLDVNQTREVNFTLPLAATSTEVTVTATPPLINAADGTLGGLVNEKQLTTLPLNGRDMVNLAYLQPGVVKGTDGSGMHQITSGNFSSNGTRSVNGGGYMDGFNTTDYELGGATLTGVNLDAIAEFRLIQNNYSAAYGGGVGSVLQAVTKSGSNAFHGSAFEFVRNDALDATNFFAKHKNPYKRNEFGGTIGGPLMKDRAFFFAQYQGTRIARGVPLVTPVPTAAERNGVIGIPGSGGDTWIVPLSANGATVLNGYPMPNDPGGSFGAQTYAVLAADNRPANQASFRIDYKISDKDTLYALGVYMNHSIPFWDSDRWILNPQWSGWGKFYERKLGLAWTHTINPTMVNSWRAAVGRTNMENGWYDHVTPNISISGITNYGPAAGGFREQPVPIEISDDLNLTKGRHSIQVGGLFLHLRDYNIQYPRPQGNYSFGPGRPLPIDIPSASGLNDLHVGDPSPLGLVSLAIGSPGGYSRRVSMPGFGPADGSFAPFTLRSWRFAGYIEDDIRATSKLTINLGFRYEYNSVPTESAGRLLGFGDDPSFLGGAVYYHVTLNPDPLYFPDYRGVGPRLGLAYKLTNKTVLRGGFGMFTGVQLAQYTSEGSGAAYFSTASGSTRFPDFFNLTPEPITNVPSVRDINGNVMPPGNDTHNIPTNTPVDFNSITNFIGEWNTGSGQLTSQHLRNGYNLQGNATVEHEFSGGVVAQVSYVSTTGVGLPFLSWPNGYGNALPPYNPVSQVSPHIGGILVIDNSAHSTYHAFQVGARRTMARLQFGANYTWGHMIDTAHTWGSYPNDLLCKACEKATSNLDVTHNFTSWFLYNLPFDTWMSSSPKWLTKGWQVSSLIRAQSGFPFTVGSNRSVAGQGSNSWKMRAEFVQPAPRNTGDAPANQYFSQAVATDGRLVSGVYFSIPGCPNNVCESPFGASRPGNLGRNTFRGWPWSNWDFSLIKDTSIRENLTVQFRAEFFNLLNQHAFDMGGVTGLGNSGFGVSTSTVNPERQIQLGLRLVF